MPNKKKWPITRVSKFYDKTDFSLENDMAREFVEGDLNFIVVLFKVDRIKSQTDDTYGEADAEEIQFHPPLEIKVRPVLNPSEQKSYSEGYGRYEDYGNLVFTVFVDQLKELDTDIDYGDYIGYPVTETEVRFYSKKVE